jgi:hypothetical protein
VALAQVRADRAERAAATHAPGAHAQPPSRNSIPDGSGTGVTLASSQYPPSVMAASELFSLKLLSPVPLRLAKVAPVARVSRALVAQIEV